MVKTILITVLLLIVTSFAAKAIYVENEAHQIELPNGETHTIYITGDEFFRWVHDESGYSLCLEQDGYYYYASGFENGKWISSGIKLGTTNPEKANLKKRISPSDDYFKQEIAPLKSSTAFQGQGMTNGESTAIIILIKFSDQTDFTETYLNTINNTLNDPNGNSVYSYYNEVSYGKLKLNGYIINDTYTSSFPRNYYLEYNATTNPTGYNNTTEKNNRRRELLSNAVQHVQTKLPSGMKHDMNNDGKFDFVAFIIKGNSASWGDLLWPHASSNNFNNVAINGLKFGSYSFLTENRTGRSTFTHEFFHNMGAPDLYRYTNSDINPAPQSFADANHMNAYMKWKHSDGTWIKEIPTITQSGQYTLHPLASTDNFGENKCAYRIPSPYNESEYFIVEYRKKDSNTLDNVPKSGMMIYRINPTRRGNGSGPPDEVYVYRTNGTYLHNGQKDNFFFGTGYNLTEINDNVNPSSHLSNGFAGGLNIESVGTPGDSIVFTINMQPQTTILGGGIYTISNSSSNNLLAAQQIEVTGNTQEQSQSAKWILDYLGNGQWKIINRGTGKALTLPGNNPNAGSKLTIADYSGSIGQKWYIFTAGKNQFQIASSVNNKLCISNNNGEVATATFNTSNLIHRWNFVRDSNYIEPSVAYALISKQSGKAIEVATATNVYQNITQLIRNQQRWIFETNEENNKFLLKSVSLNQYLSAGNATAETKPIESATNWDIIHNPDGTVKISDQASGRVLSSSKNVYANSQKINLEDPNHDDDSQRFYLVNMTNFKSNYVEPDYPEVTLSDLKRDLYMYLPYENEIKNEGVFDDIEIDVEIKGTPTFIAGKYGQALNFNGTTDYLLANSQATYNPALDDFSLCVWTLNKADASDTGDRVILQQTDGDEGSVGRTTYHASPKTDRFSSYLGAVSNGTNTGTYSTSREKWTHHALISDRVEKTLTFMINGIIETIVPLTDVEWCNGNLLIGAQKALQPARFFKGIMDEFYLYKRVLNPAEVRAVMNNELNTLGTNADLLTNRKTNSLYVWPNPANSSIYLGGNDYSGASYSIFTINGTELLKGTYSQNGIDVQTLQRGLYLIHVNTPQETNIVKVSIK